MRKAKPYIGVLFLLAVFGGAHFFLEMRTRSRSIQHVFVNETADHRFDESIQVSILAAASRTGVQSAVVISDRYSAVEMEAQAAQLFTRLGLGRNNNGRAILYLFSPGSHALKIEVGHALEGVMPDSKLRFLELAAKTFTFADRYQDFWAEMINTVNIEIQEAEKPQREERDNPDFSRFRFLSGGAGVFSGTYDASPQQLEAEMRKLPAGSGAYAPGSSPRETLDRYLASMAAGIGDPSLPLLSGESRVFRSFTPLSTFQLYRNARMCARAGLDRIIVSGKLAFAFFRPGNPVLPVLLARGADGRWRVNEPLAWALFHRYEDSQRVFLKYPLATGSTELEGYLQAEVGRPIYRGSPVDPEGDFGPAGGPRWYYFRFFWLEKVQAALEKSTELAGSEELLRIAADTSLNLGRMSEFLARLEALSQLRSGDKELRHAVRFYREAFRFEGEGWRRELGAN